MPTPEPVSLAVPAPWALGIVLGLVRAWRCPRRGDHRGRVEIVQTASQGDLAGALRHLQALARARCGPGPEMQAPWRWAFEPGPLGSAEVVNAYPVGSLIAPTWEWVFADPRPGWTEIAA